MKARLFSWGMRGQEWEEWKRGNDGLTHRVLIDLQLHGRLTERTDDWDAQRVAHGIPSIFG